MYHLPLILTSLCIHITTQHTQPTMLRLVLHKTHPRAVLPGRILPRHASTDLGGTVGTFPIASNSSGSDSNTALVPRHGTGDGVIKLNVGGKEFVTLRSTIQSNAVLADYVRRAEQNGECLREGNIGTTGAVFVDRDPKHFAIILTFLRNKTEGIAYNSKWAKQQQQPNNNTTRSTLKRHLANVVLDKHPKYVRLPTQDPAALQDLYVEAVHFDLYELQKQLCQQSLMTTMLAATTGGNPFEYANNMFKQARRIALGLVGTGSVTFATTQTDINDWFTKTVQQLAET